MSMRTPKEIADGIVDVNHELAFASVADEPCRYLLDFGDKHQRISTFVAKLRKAIAAAIQAERDVRPPKGHIVTDDGVVREVVCISRAGTASAIGKSWDGEMMTDIRVVGDCYSTRQAAEAAKKGAKK